MDVIFLHHLWGNLYRNDGLVDQLKILSNQISFWEGRGSKFFERHRAHQNKDP